MSHDRSTSGFAPRALSSVTALVVALLAPALARASEANIKLPSLDEPIFFGDTTSGASILYWGLLVSSLGLVFGFWQSMQIRNRPVHSSMLEISELIYATCKQYLITQGRFMKILWVFIAAVIAVYFGWLMQDP